jgi:REP element-mobilizing transposase RayT
MKPAVSVSEVMKTVKAKSSKFINDHALTTSRFEWQRGYGVFSYYQSLVNTVYHYIWNQEAHHAARTFRKEYLELLKEFELEYDEQYLFQELV